MADVLVLCYHAVSERWDAALSVTPADLREQLEKLLRRGWVGATFRDAIQAPAPRTLAVTFDDAFDSVRTLAAPILRELGVPGTVFVPSDWVGQRLMWPEVARWAQTEHADELQAMSWDALRELEQREGWEIGAHTCSHPHLPRLEPGAALVELRASREVCVREGLDCRTVAYPFGECDDRVLEAATRAGFVAAAGLSQEAFTGRNPLNWPRVGVWHGEPSWRFDIKVAPLTSQARRVSGAVHLAIRRRVGAVHVGSTKGGGAWF